MSFLFRSFTLRIFIELSKRQAAQSSSQEAPEKGSNVLLFKIGAQEISTLRTYLPEVVVKLIESDTSSAYSILRSDSFFVLSSLSGGRHHAGCSSARSSSSQSRCRRHLCQLRSSHVRCHQRSQLLVRRRFEHGATSSSPRPMLRRTTEDLQRVTAVRSVSTAY